MRLFFVLIAFMFVTSATRADVAPDYVVYTIGAQLEEADPFPKLTKVTAGGPSEKAGLKNGDAVIAIDGSYSKGVAPFYFFARGLQGPRNSVVELVILRDGKSVSTVRIKRTLRR